MLNYKKQKGLNAYLESSHGCPIILIQLFVIVSDSALFNPELLNHIICYTPIRPCTQFKPLKFPQCQNRNLICIHNPSWGGMIQLARNLCCSSKFAWIKLLVVYTGIYGFTHNIYMVSYLKSQKKTPCEIVLLANEIKQ